MAPFGKAFWVVFYSFKDYLAFKDFVFIDALLILFPKKFQLEKANLAALEKQSHDCFIKATKFAFKVSNYKSDYSIKAYNFSTIFLNISQLLKE